MFLRYQVNKYGIVLRFYSTKNIPKKEVKYTHTVNLPKTKFPARLSPVKRQEIEQNLVKRCFANLYSYQRENNTNPEFVLHDGPPYANGSLHLGHSVNKILKDITVRQHVINRRKVEYKPGWDCHGLPIELKATSGAEPSTDSLSIREKSREFATNTIEMHKREFESWGVVADWNNSSNLYKTFDAEYVKNQLNVFLTFYDRSLIYRSLKPVYWSPSSKSALAEAELEYNPNFISPSVLLRLKLSRLPPKLKMLFGLDPSAYAVIWTTTPWTLPSNQAVCYSPVLKYSLIQFLNDKSKTYLVASELVGEFEKMTERQTQTLGTISGEDLHGTQYFHPFDKKEELPFLPSPHVQSSKGTGLVHTAPAHGPEDFLISLENKIKVKCLVNEEGKYTTEAPEFLHSKHVLDEGNELVQNYLKNDFLYSSKITHSYPIDWRTKKPVILRASKQWFINTEKIKAKAIDQLKNVQIYPKNQSDSSKKALITQLEKRPYWCISRQRAWGVPIPVFYDKQTNTPITNKSIISRLCDLLDKHKKIDFWWSMEISDLLTEDILKGLGKNPDDIEKGKDILDIWFDSGISWSYALKDNKIADLFLEGHDQFTGWFQSSLMTSIAYRGLAPFKSIFVHGFTVDEKGLKMSKSLGNIISPIDIISKYGIDTMRWWVAAHATQHSSITVSDHLLQGCAESLAKIRTTLKFLIGSLNEFSEEKFFSKPKNPLKISFLDRYMLHTLIEFEEDVQHLYDSYDYNRVIAALQHFVTNEISGFYVHLSKDRLYCGTEAQISSVQYVLHQAFLALCKMLWPIAPFLVEECWSYFDAEPFYKKKVKMSRKFDNVDAVTIINGALDVRNNLNKQIKDVNTWMLDVTVTCSTPRIRLLKILHPATGKPLNSTELCEILQVASVTLIDEPDYDEAEGWRIETKTIESSLCPRCRRFRISDKEDVCQRCDTILVARNDSSWSYTK